MRSLFLLMLIGAAALAGCDRTPAGSSDEGRTTLSIAVAASMKHAMDEVIASFAKQHPSITIKATYGSSGSFFAQIQSGAPFDLFFSADADYPARIVEAKFAVEADLFPYATGRLVIWVHKDSPIDLDKLGFAALLEPSVRKIAIANPKLAPYGRAAEQAIIKQGLMDQVQSKFVLGENIAQTAQYLESGAAEIGLIAQSLAMLPTMKAKGRTWLVPDDMHEAIAQSGVILGRTKSREAAQTLRDYLLGAEGQAILVKHGFASPTVAPNR